MFYVLVAAQRLEVGYPVMPTRYSWQLQSIFPALDGEAHRGYETKLFNDLTALGDCLADAKRAGSDGGKSLASLLLEMEGIEERASNLVSYAWCVVAKDQTSNQAQAALSRAQKVSSTLRLLRSLVQRQLRIADRGVQWLTEENRLAHAYHWLRRQQREAAYLLTEAEETLIADLEGDALHRWSRLATSSLGGLRLILRSRDGKIDERPFADRYDLIWDRDAHTRSAGFAALNAAAESEAHTLAACLNGITGARTSVAKRRGIGVFDHALVRNDVRPETYAAMEDGLKRRAEILRDYLERKRTLLGLNEFGIFDRSAPLPGCDHPVACPGEPLHAIANAFRAVVPALADYAEHMARSGWIDDKPGGRKAPGGFCSPFPASRETRILVSYRPSLPSLAAYAHELGHAYHFHRLFNVAHFARETTSVLAETAAILGEHLVRRAIIRDQTLPGTVRRAAVAAHLDAAVNYLVRIPRDTAFERDVYDRRIQGDLSVEQLCEIAAARHIDWFGNATQGDGNDRWSWAYNHLLYLADSPFYNFPYTIAFALSNFIADDLMKDGGHARQRLDRFYAQSGSMGCEELMRSVYSVDIGDAAFWECATDSIETFVEAVSEA